VVRLVEKQMNRPQFLVETVVVTDLKVGDVIVPSGFTGFKTIDKIKLTSLSAHIRFEDASWTYPGSDATIFRLVE
jgi:hypothetical protein